MSELTNLQVAMLHYMRENPDRTMAQLQWPMDRGYSAISLAMRDLEKRGLVQRSDRHGEGWRWNVVTPEVDDGIVESRSED